MSASIDEEKHSSQDLMVAADSGSAGEPIEALKSGPPDNSDAQQQVMTIPDGGLQACLVVVGGACVQFCTFGYSSSFGVYEDYYVLHGGLTSSNASWIGSLQFFLLFSLGLPTGKLFDLGYFRHMQIAGILLYVFSLFMLSLADVTQYYQLILSQGIGMGLGGGLLLVPTISLQAHYWKKHRALVMGIILAASSCGGIVYPIMLNQLIHSSVGFPWAVRATAFLTLGMLCIAACLTKPRLPSAKHRPPTPMPGIKGIFQDPAYLMTLFGIFMVFWGLMFPYFYLQLWANLHGISSAFSFYTIAILNAGSIFGRLLPNRLADSFGQFNLICTVSVVSSALLFALFGVKSEAAVIVFAILYGFFSGAGYFVASFALLTGSPIDGALLGPEHHWPKAIVFSGVVMFVGSAAFIAARHLFARTRKLDLLGKL
ncbi:predicted protein [Postia placenta Mad-698-R]|uniref:MFS general substrate transporter n=1 Tax=Rhodonia placenta TaxID=104341 RepID=A0A8H7U1F0_9APHY|nr:predicted protein [Postia placenta Mad-698-R]KAF9812185.1 hypothetical protein IEO21_06327 [Postia placenta]